MCSRTGHSHRLFSSYQEKANYYLSRNFQSCGKKRSKCPTRKPSDLLSSCGSGSRILLRPLQPESGHAAHLNVHLLPKRRESLLDLLRPAEVFQVEQPIDVRPWYTQSAR